MSTPARCDVPQLDDAVILPEGARLPEGFTRKVLYVPVAAYCATVTARGGEGVTEPTDDYSPQLRKAMRLASRGLHKVDVRAIHARVAELKLDGKDDDFIILQLNRGEAVTDAADLAIDGV